MTDNTHQQLTFRNSDIKLFHQDRLGLNIPAMEKQHGALYVGEFTLRAKDGSWANQPVAVFYQRVPHPEGSNYFGLFHGPRFPGDLEGTWFITNAIACTEHQWAAAVSGNDAVYSAYRHDYQTLGELMADGGPEYFRSNGRSGMIKFEIKDGGLYVV